MSNSNTIIYIHLSWATKNRNDNLRNREMFEIVKNHIIENGRRKKISIDCVGGAVDHIHVLLKLYKTDNIGRIVKLIKGESSWWLRRNVEQFKNFEWQVGYDARSVHYNQLNTVRNYINNQEQHHSDK